MNPQAMAQYLRGQDPQQLQQLISQYLDPQQAAFQGGMMPIQQPVQMGMGGFRQPQLPTGGMGTMQGQLPIQQGIIR